MKPAAVVDAHFDIPLEGHAFPAQLRLPREPSGLVILVHSRSSREHPRHQRLADALVDAGLGALTLDYLTEDERHSAHDRYDTDLHARRLLAARDFAQVQWADRCARLGYFASGSAAAAAVQAAAMRPAGVQAVVCLQGRPDMAGCWLSSLEAPTLLVVDQADAGLRVCNTTAAGRITAPSQVHAIPRLVEDGQARAVEEAVRWFSRHLAPLPPGARAARPAYTASLR